METLAVFHILKTGGTTIVDRYKHNAGFAYQRVKHELVLNYQQANQITLQIDQDTCSPDVVFGHGVSFDWNSLTDNVKYATILRHPIDRIISAFNYFKLEMYNIHDVRTEIDFSTWFINKSRLIPTPVFNQFQTFTDMPDSCLYTDYGLNINETLSEQLYNLAINNINHIDHVLFMEDDYVKKFDGIMINYNMIPALDIVHSHNTKEELNYIGDTYITYEKLDKNNTELLNKHMKKDIQFYEYCRNKFK